MSCFHQLQTRQGVPHLEKKSLAACDSVSYRFPGCPHIEKYLDITEEYNRSWDKDGRSYCYGHIEVFMCSIPQTAMALQVKATGIDHNTLLLACTCHKKQSKKKILPILLGPYKKLDPHLIHLPSLSLCVPVFGLWYIVHHLTGTGLRCAPPTCTCIVHHGTAWCTNVSPID